MRSSLTAPPFVALAQQVVPQVEIGLHVLVEARDLRIGHEDDAVDALQHELAAGVVVALAGHRVQVEARLHALDGAQREGQEVEVERALFLGRDAHELAAGFGVDLAVDVLQVGGLAAEPAAVVDDLVVDLAGGEVDQRHAGALTRL